MSSREQQFTGSRQQDHPAPIHSFDSVIQSVLYGDGTHERWQVVLHDCSSGEDHLCHYTAASADDAESMAHHDVIEGDPLGSYSVQALGVVPRRCLWVVQLQGRARLDADLPPGLPLVIGRVVAANEDEARAQALATFGWCLQASGTDDVRRYLSPGDPFTVVCC